MGRRGGYNNTLILRGESPEFDMNDDDEFGGGDDEFDDEFGDGGGDDMFKGRSVNGPRTKLSASMDGRIDRMEAGISRLAKGMTLFGRYLQSQQRKARVAKHGEPDGDEFGMGGGMGDMGGGYEEEEDPMAIPPEGDEDHLDLAAGPQLRATGEGTNLSVRKAKVAKGKVTKGQLQLAVATLRKAGYIVGQHGVTTSLVSKDDAASSFGEKDSNVPGNRPFDQEDVGEDDTVIQGGPSAGPGPVSKGSGSESFESRVQKAMVPTMTAVLEAYGLQPMQAIQLPDPTGSRVMKAVAPSPGGAPSFDSKIDNAAGGPDLDQLFDQVKAQSWGSINRLRVEMGDLTGGIL